MRMNASRTQRTIINTLAGIVSQFFTIFLNFAFRTVFIRTLGVQYTGVSSVFTSILSMLSLSELGFGTAIATALYHPLREKDEEQIRKLMTFYRMAYRWIAFFIMAVGLMLTPFLDYIITDVPDIKEDIRLIYILFIIKTATSYLMVYKTTLMKADQKLYIVKALEMVCMGIRYMVEIVCLLIFKQYMTYLFIEVAATIAQNYVVTKRAEKEYPGAYEKPEEKISKETVINLFKDVKGLFMYKVSASVGNSIDTLLISSFISTTTVGLLANYNMIRHQIDSTVKQLFSAVIPSIGNLAAERNDKKQFLVFNRLFYISFVIVNFCSVSLFVLFNPFITFWLGEKYLLGNEIAFIIAADFFLYILLQAIASFRTANGLFVKGQYRPLATAILNIIFSLILIKYYGIFGTIFATVICRLVTQWYDPYLLFKYVFHEKFRLFYLKYWLYIIMFISGAFLTNWISFLLEVQNVFGNIMIRAVLCVLIPNLWVALFTSNTKEYRYVIELVLGRIKRKKND